MRHYVIATAGHVDHGKSSLVKALTGTDPDRLPEEKARQITIDLGFAELDLGNDIHAAMVDVPGHEDFVRNMIAGVGSIDLALLVIAADDGWMPQTEEHLQILEYLDVRRAVIALTKSDIGDADDVERQIRDQLHGTSFTNAPVIRTALHHKSLMLYDGVQDLKRAIATELADAKPQRDIGKPRLFVDRAFTLRGIGTVVTGTLTDGKFRPGENVFVQPRNLPARIRSLQSHGRDIDLALPGTRAALNLPELELEKEIHRGDTITTGSFKLSAALGVTLMKSVRSSNRPVNNRARVWLHHGTRRVAARVRFFGREGIRSGEQAVARIDLDSPVVALTGDRFVLRDPSERFTIAGGVVLDWDGGHGEESLCERAAAPNDIDAHIRTELRTHRCVPIASLLYQSRFSAEDVATVLQSKNILVRNGLAVDEAYWNGLRMRAIALIDRVHRESSEKSGPELSELRSAFYGNSPELIEAVMNDLCANEFVRSGSTIARREHRATLPPSLQEPADGILKQLSVKPFDPPARKQTAPDKESQQALRFLIGAGQVIELGPDVVVLSASFEEMKAAVVAFVAKNGEATVSELRQELQTSRRIMVPFLECLDREGVTRRTGDKRKLADDIVARALK